MARWRYFIGAPTLELLEAGKVLLTRLPEGAPVALAEVLRPPGEWHHDLLMWRVRYLGSDHEFREITEDDARELVHGWVARGRLDRMPDDASSITPERAEVLTRLERDAGAVWRDV